MEEMCLRESSVYFETIIVFNFCVCRNVINIWCKLNMALSYCYMN
jgi:hypothetical protein